MKNFRDSAVVLGKVGRVDITSGSQPTSSASVTPTPVWPYTKPSCMFTCGNQILVPISVTLGLHFRFGITQRLEVILGEEARRGPRSTLEFIFSGHCGTHMPVVWSTRRE